MSISEVIEKLNAIKKQHGDIQVKVQYRDADSTYSCADDEILFTVDHNSRTYFVIVKF